LYTINKFFPIIRNTAFIFFYNQQSRAVTGSFIGRKTSFAYEA
jgi:hypothetical protein